MTAIADLGAGYLRGDIRWRDLLPDGNKLDIHARNWYRHYLRTAHEWYGLTPMVVLSNPPNAVMKLDEGSRIAAWGRYIDVVITEFGDLCQRYQLMNEINSPVFRFVSSANVPRAMAEAVSRMRAQLPNCELMTNILADLWGWRQATQQCIDRFGSQLDIIGLDFYPETWAVSLGSPWSAVEAGLIDLYATNPKLPRIAILETGYSTNIPIFRGEEQQVRFYHHLRSTLDILDSQRGGRSLAYIGLYEICDENSSIVLDPEAHFGLLKSKSLQRKTAFAQARQICDAFR
jgi:hypothetical protein